MRVQITDVEGKPMPGFAFADGRPITTDELAASLPVDGTGITPQDITPTPTPNVNAPVPAITVLETTVNAGQSVHVNGLTTQLKVGDILGGARAVREIKQCVDLADRAVDPPPSAKVAPMEHEPFDRHGKPFPSFCYFCHNRNIGKDGTEVKRLLAGLSAGLRMVTVATGMRRAPRA